MRTRLRRGADAFLVGLVGCVVSIAAGCGGDDDSRSEADKSGGTLFVLSAEEGGFRPAGGSSDRADLTLEQASGKVVAFTDRPQRRVSSLSIRDLVRLWPKLGFATDPPNAALEVEDGPATRNVIVVEISKPHLRPDGAISFRARMLPGTQAPAGLETLGARADKRLPARFGGATLFIDDAGGQCEQNCEQGDETCVQGCSAECANSPDPSACVEACVQACVSEYGACVASCAQTRLPRRASTANVFSRPARLSRRLLGSGRPCARSPEGHGARAAVRRNGPGKT
ncbi:MAG: hypothetical protein WD649_06550 [Thermoleophilaceae bacterium]